MNARELIEQLISEEDHLANLTALAKKYRGVITKHVPDNYIQVEFKFPSDLDDYKRAAEKQGYDTDELRGIRDVYKLEVGFRDI